MTRTEEVGKYLQSYSCSILIINLVLFIFWSIEVKLRRIACCKLYATYIMLFLSLSFSFSSSFLHVFIEWKVNEYHDMDGSGDNQLQNINIICNWGSKSALVCKLIAKHCIWAFFVVRARLVLNSIESKLIPKMAKYSPFILVLYLLML